MFYIRIYQYQTNSLIPTVLTILPHVTQILLTIVEYNAFLMAMFNKQPSTLLETVGFSMTVGFIKVRSGVSDDDGGHYDPWQYQGTRVTIYLIEDP